MLKVFLISSFLIFSCSKRGLTPSGALQDYIDYRFSSGQSKDKTLSLVTGPLFVLVNEKTDEELERFNNATVGHKKRDFKILLEKCESNGIEECHLTYLISYDVLEKGKKSYSIEVKKMAAIQKDQGKWKVADVKNIKTYIDSKKGIKIKE